MEKILVLCTGNSCRSQIAHGYLETMNPNLEVYSAGVEIHGLNPRAVKVMLEDGIDISGYQSNHVRTYIGINFDLVLTVCDHADNHCPVFPKAIKRIHCSFKDPAKSSGSEDEIMQVFRQVRNQIKQYVQQLVDVKIR